MSSPRRNRLGWLWTSTSSGSTLISSARSPVPAMSAANVIASTAAAPTAGRKTIRVVAVDAVTAISTWPAPSRAASAAAAELDHFDGPGPGVERKEQFVCPDPDDAVVDDRRMLDRNADLVVR